MTTNKNKVAITDCSRGIGSAIAKRLDSSGLAVIVNYAGFATMFVTNGGYNGVQQVLRLSDTAITKERP